MYKDFTQSLADRLKEPLPGLEAQLKMASQFRLPLDMNQFDLSKAKRGAVLILLYPHENTINTVLTLRPSYKGVHSGQVSFPGGKPEPSDVNLAATALREANEEIGLITGSVELIGTLSDLYIPPSNFLVSPFIAKVSEKPILIRNEREVEKIIEVPLTYFLDESVRKEKEVNPYGKFKFTTPYYDVFGDTVWGATAMMLSEMMEIIKSLNNAK